MNNVPSFLKPVESKQSKKKDSNTPSFLKPVEHKQEDKEGFLKSTARYAAQIPKGIAQSKFYYLDLINMIGVGDALDPEEIDHIRAISEREGIPFDEEAYLQAVKDASESFPTVNNVSRAIEEKTGLPLQAKTWGQTGLEAATSLVHPNISISKKTKPSGMLQRKYESIQNARKVSEKTKSRINESVESEFRKISDKIIEGSPIKDTRAALKDGPEFKIKAEKAFEEVQKLSESLTERVSSKSLKKKVSDLVANRKSKGFIPSDYEKEYSREINSLINQTKKDYLTPSQLIEQYRKNNASLSQIYEPGRSFASNKAKRDAILDFNRGIASTIESEVKSPSLVKLFKDSNESWSNIKNVESVERFIDSLFDGKIKFDKARNFFEKNGVKESFEKSLGKKGFKDFEQLMKDLISTEKANKLLKVAEKKGFKDVAESALAYVVHPKIGNVKAAAVAARSIARNAYQRALVSPEILVDWRRGVEAFKKGDFELAGRIFSEITKMNDEDEI